MTKRLEKLLNQSYVTFKQVERLTKEERLYLNTHGNHYVVDYTKCDEYGESWCGAYLNNILNDNGSFVR